MLADLINTWTTEPSKRKWTFSYIPLLLSFLLICFIAWQFANLFWAWKSPTTISTDPTIETSQTTTPNSSQNNTSYDLNKIKQANLFGVYVSNDEAPVQEALPTEETQLSLTLHGTLLSDNKEQSRAIIEVDNKDKVFSVGDEIQNNVSLDSVLAYQVILNNRGKKEILKLPRQDEGSTQSGSQRTKAPVRNSSANKIAQQIKASALKNPSSITDILRLKKGQTSSGQKGFRVYPGKDRDRFRDLGLKAGDFVTMVNGMPVAEQNPFQVIQTLTSTSYINLTIERNGQPMNLSFDIGATN